jgi:hypothetical protein
MAKQKRSATSSQRKPTLPASYFFTNSLRIQIILIAVIGLGFYSNSFFNEYALDDGVVIAENKWVQDGFGGIGNILTHGELDAFYEKYGGSEQFAGGRYRPLSIVTFAIEQGIFGNDPHPRHLFNILYYVATLIFMLYFLRTYVIPGRPDIAFLATLLFAIHPVHSEVIANIKSRNELFPLLFYLLMFIFCARSLERNKTSDVLLGCLFLFLSLLSKEYAVLMLALLPLFFILIGRLPAHKAIPKSLPYFAVIAVYWLMRMKITAHTHLAREATQEVLNNQYILATAPQKFATKIFVLGKYLWMLIFPKTLCVDYSYNQIPFVGLDDPKFLLSLSIHIGLVVTMLLLLYRKKYILGFFMLFYFAHLFLISNLAIEIGTTFSERLIYNCSFAFCVIMAFLIVEGLNKLGSMSLKTKRLLFLPILVVVVVLCGFKVVDRNAIWKNNFTLFTNDVSISTNSVLVNGNAGREYIALYERLEDKEKPAARQYLEKALVYLQKAVELDKNYVNGYLNLGWAYYELEQYEKAYRHWMMGKRILPTHPNLKECAMVMEGQAVEAARKKQYEQARQFAWWAAKIDSKKLVGK